MRKRSLFSTIIIVISLIVVVVSLCSLIPTLRDYWLAKHEYASIAEEYADTKPVRPDVETEGDGLPVIDWDGLKKENEEVIGWLHCSWNPEISYPICQSEDNSYYLHRTFKRQNLFAGSLFLDYTNSSNFVDSVSIIYGHNMKDGTMFGKLPRITQEEYDNGIIWILTPSGNLKYKVFSCFKTNASSDVYRPGLLPGEEYVEWERQIASESKYQYSGTFGYTGYEKAIVLSTCTAASGSGRFVLIGMREGDVQ